MTTCEYCDETISPDDGGAIWYHEDTASAFCDGDDAPRLDRQATPAAFDTYTEATRALVIDPLLACGQDLDDFDIDAIAEAVIGYAPGLPGDFLYTSAVDVDTFWQIVRQHDRTQTAPGTRHTVGSAFYDTLMPAIVTGPRPVHGRYV